MRQHRLWWQSSYDRGILHLLQMWPKIKETYPDAELWITYGWDTFDAMFRDNPERQAWKGRAEEKMKQPGISHFGRLGKQELRGKRLQCGIWPYTCHFQEINCIGALESQADGLVPVTMNDFALKETVGSGIKIDGDIYETEVYENYLTQLLMLMGNKALWKQESAKAIKFAQDYSWDKISLRWIDVFKK